MMHFCLNHHHILLLMILLSSLLFIKTEAVEKDKNDILIVDRSSSNGSSSNVVTTNTTSSSSRSLQSMISSCRIIGYKMYYASGYEDLMSFRQDAEVLDDGYYICVENVGDNIEAILNPECNRTLLKQHGIGVRMLLRNRTPTKRRATGIGMILHNQTEYNSPYFLYGNNGSQIFGKVIPVGSYQLTSFLTNNTSRMSGTKALDVNFHMAICSKYFLPKNECNECSSQTCEGSQCVPKSITGIRIVLLIYGQDTYDFGMNVTSPLGTTLNAYYKTNRANYIIWDNETLGYVSNDYLDDSCVATGVWMKQINYPTSIPGTYNITLENILKCPFLPFPNQNRYMIRIYNKEILMKHYISNGTDPTGEIFQFTV